jgi:hypothetical protein
MMKYKCLDVKMGKRKRGAPLKKEGGKTRIRRWRTKI